MALSHVFSVQSDHSIVQIGHQIRHNAAVLCEWLVRIYSCYCVNYLKEGEEIRVWWLVLILTAYQQYFLFFSEY